MTNITFEGKWEGSEATFECKHELIKALLIFYKYDTEFWTASEHDSFYVQVKPSLVSDEDTEELKKLGFVATEYGFESSRWGSC